MPVNLYQTIRYHIPRDIGVVVVRTSKAKESLEECHQLGCDAVRGFDRTDVSEVAIASIIRVERIGELETTSAVTSN
jgi:hypothetical protein